MARTTAVEFTGAAGQTISGRLELPAGTARSWALFAHCFTCSKDLKAVVRISRALADRGIGVLRFDFTGLGESEGDFTDTDFRSNLGDLAAAARFLAERYGEVQLLIGHSLGGAAALAGAADIDSVRAVVTIGAPSDTRHLQEQILASEPQLERVESAEVELGGRPVAIGRRLVEDLGRQDLSIAIAGLGRALLILHSPVDETVSIDHAARIYKAARHPKSFVSLDGADHLLLARDEDSRFVAEVVAAWAGRYLEMGAPEDRDLAPGEVLVSSRGDRFTHDVRSDRHHWIADEPESVGGDDLGPSPYELLVSAIAACKAMTMRMYARRKGWELGEVEVRARHDRRHERDCENCADGSAKVDHVEVRLDVAGELDREQRARLAEIADRCPVHKTLEGPIRIETELDDRAS